MFAMGSRLPTSARDENRPRVLGIEPRELGLDAVVPFRFASALDSAREANRAGAPDRCSSAHAAAVAHALELEREIAHFPGHNRAQFPERNGAHFHRRLRSIEHETGYASAYARMHDLLTTRDPHVLERPRTR